MSKKPTFLTNPLGYAPGGPTPVAPTPPLAPLGPAPSRNDGTLGGSQIANITRGQELGAGWDQYLGDFDTGTNKWNDSVVQSFELNKRRGMSDEQAWTAARDSFIQGPMTALQDTQKMLAKGNDGFGGMLMKILPVIMAGISGQPTAAAWAAGTFGHGKNMLSTLTNAASAAIGAGGLDSITGPIGDWFKQALGLGVGSGGGFVNPGALGGDPTSLFASHALGETASSAASQGAGYGLGMTGANLGLNFLSNPGMFNPKPVQGYGPSAVGGDPASLYRPQSLQPQNNDALKDAGKKLLEGLGGGAAPPGEGAGAPTTNAVDPAGVGGPGSTLAPGGFPLYGDAQQSIGDKAGVGSRSDPGSWLNILRNAANMGVYG